MNECADYCPYLVSEGEVSKRGEVLGPLHSHEEEARRTLVYRLLPHGIQGGLGVHGGVRGVVGDKLLLLYAGDINVLLVHCKRKQRLSFN